MKSLETRESDMSEVLIVLNLRRRSGVLAAAVAAVHRADLEFGSQQTKDQAGIPQLHLHADGEVSDVGRVVEIFSNVSGVSEVADVRVDGRSLLHQVEPEPQVEVEPIGDSKLETAPEPKPEPEPARSSPQPKPPESNPAPASDRKTNPEAVTPAMVRRRRRRR
jgi:outer membrane biosynthesis protein TonB